MRMPRPRRLAAPLALCLAAGCSHPDSTAPTPATGPADVFTPGNVFSPFNTVIHVGGTVRFNISGEAHNVVFRGTAGAPADVPVATNAVVSRTFTTKGTFPYDCTVHPGMSGQVVVQ
jgi:plastocyanin